MKASDQKVVEEDLFNLVKYVESVWRVMREASDHGPSCDCNVCWWLAEAWKDLCKAESESHMLEVDDDV